jgi:hypothetical protein
MSHILTLYAPPDQSFAKQLSVQLEQRGLVVWPVPDPLAAQPTPNLDQGLPDASHILLILSPEAVELVETQAQITQALDHKRHTIVVVCRDCTIPDTLKPFPVVDFEGQFLLAVEELVRRLQKTDAPTRPLTVEHPPPVVKTGLMPIRLPAERCWREDRLRINYNLPIILAEDDLALRLPAFLAQTQFDLIRSTSKSLRARRKHKEFALFDPRRAQHTLSIKRRKGRLRVYYRMTRLQVYHWFPAHYRVLDREAAALFRYLATGTLDGILDPVHRQASRARRVSWAAIAGVILVLLLVAYLIFV